MTVLLAAGSPEGVAIAADGFRHDFHGTFSTDVAQKVWPGQTRDGRVVAFGWCGQTLIEKLCESFSFPDYSLAILRHVDLGRYDNCPLEMVSDFARTLTTKLEAFLMDYDPRISTVPLSDSIAKVLLAWFAGEKPICAAVAFSRADGAIQADIQTLEMDVEDFVCMVSGSPTLYERGMRTITNLEDAIAVAKTFAQACVDNRNIIPDCADYGGHVHAGAVSKDGFFWAVPPAQSHVCD